MNTKPELNGQQQKAVNTKKDKVLVLAGAGTGKTSTLVARIINEINMGIPANEIVAVTFTNKAANEIKERVLDEFGTAGNINELTIGTFHGISNRMLRDNNEVLGLSPYYQIIDASEQKQIIKEIVSENRNQLSVDEYADIKDSHIVKLSVSKIAKMKEYGVTYADAENPSDIDWDLVKIFELYEFKKYNSSLLDFADILNLSVKLLENNEMRERYNKRWTSMLVDEFQDTNSIQMKWINLINSKKLFVVGDDDQSIYKFRGADIKNILDFEKTQQSPEIINLEENYRSTASILEIANEIISHNKHRHEKRLWTNNSRGKQVNIDEYNSASQESSKVVNKIADLIGGGARPSDIAIIYRANYLSRLFEKPLMKYAINYKITGGVGFWQRSEIKNVLSYLMVAMNKDNFVSLERSLRFPSRGVGIKTIKKIVDYSKIEKIDLIESIEQLIDAKTIKGKASRELVEYVDIIKTIGMLDIDDAVGEILSRIKIQSIYSDESDADKLENLNELLAAAIDFKMTSSNKNEFLENAALMGSVDDKEAGDAVSLTTVHSSKGLEYKYVFIVGMEDGIFPSSRSLESDEDIEEERRLCYVAITRAKEELRLSYAKTRTQGGDFNKRAYMSRFMTEFDPNLVTLNKYNIY